MRLGAFACLLILLAAAPARAAQLIGDTKVPFSADRTVTWKGKSYVGRVYAEPGKQRHEQEISGLHPIAILRADQRMAYLVLPEFQIYTRLPFPKAVTEQGGLNQLGRPVAQATVAGLPAAEYDIDREGSDGSALHGKVWMTAQDIVLRVTGAYADPGRRPEEGRLELTNVQKGPQDPALFELPPGVKEMPPQAVEGLFNLRFAKHKH